MTEMTDTTQDRASGTAWFTLTPAQVQERLDVDPTDGLSEAKAEELLQKNGPNELPAEATPPVGSSSLLSTGATCRSSSWRQPSPRS